MDEYVFEIYEFIYPFIYSLASVIAAHCNYDYYSEQDLVMFMLGVMLCYVRLGFVIPNYLSVGRWSISLEHSSNYKK